jgi:hypothetical protein
MKLAQLLRYSCSFILTVTAHHAAAQNLLIGGDFEPAGGEIPGWNLEEFATGTSAILNTAELVTFNPESGTRELWLRAFAGGSDPGPDNLTNAILSQTVPGIPGESYTFAGSSRWEANYSGGVDFLFDSPLGNVMSPTATTMKLEFLNAVNATVGTPIILDLRTEQSNFNAWQSHSLSGIAPAGTTTVRVTAEARDMVYNFGPAQSAFYDNFSLTRASAPAAQLLTNPDLELLSPSGLDSWSVTQNDPEDPSNTEIVRAVGFANRPESGGTTGVWLSAFFGEPGTEVDGVISQTVPGAVGRIYTLSGWSRWEANYSGAAPTVTDTFLELAFLDDSDNVIGTPSYLDLRTEQFADNVWREHALMGIAPVGTASVRVRAGMQNGLRDFFSQSAQSAFFDDFALIVVPEPVSLVLAGCSALLLLLRRARH